jgi:hypothetical protein
MGMRTEFFGTLTASRPLTPDELKEYEDTSSKSEDMYLMFAEGSTNELEGPSGHKIAGYVDMEKGFLDTLHWMKSKGITLTGRVNYAYEDMFTDVIGGGFGAFVALPWRVTYYKLDFHGLKMVSNIIY